MIKGFAPYVASHVYGGHSFRVFIGDPLAQGWYDHDWARLPEIELLASMGRLRQGARVFDLGAHQCVVALMLAAEVGRSGSVVAVEATGHNAEVARRNLALNGVGNVIVEHAVAAGKEGTVAFAASLNGHVGKTSYAFATVDLPAVTVDSLAALYGAPDVVFVDVEGYEQHVLAGAQKTFDARPDWLVEVHAGVGLEEQGGSVRALLAEFDRRDYRLFVGDSEAGDSYEPLERAAPESRFHLVALG